MSEPTKVDLIAVLERLASGSPGSDYPVAIRTAIDLLRDARVVAKGMQSEHHIGCGCLCCQASRRILAALGEGE